jgi:hypothetical protein
MTDFFETLGEGVFSSFSDVLNDFFKSIPPEYLFYILVIFSFLAVTLYSIFVWNFYHFLARRDILRINLSQYNKSEHPTFYKLIALLIFILEYALIVPFLVFFWFFIMSLILFLLAKELPIGSVFLVSAGIIGSVRITSYYNEDLSKDLAKMFPFTILAVALVTPGFFDLSLTIAKFGEIGLFLDQIFFYMIFIVFLELLLRLFYLISPEAEIEERKEEIEGRRK